MHGGWMAQRGRGRSHQLEELALVLTEGEVRASGLGYYWTLRCYRPTCPQLKSILPLAIATSPQVLSPQFLIHGGVSCSGTFPRSGRLLKSYLKGNTWVLAGVKWQLDTNCLPSSDPLINSFFFLFPQASLPHLPSEPAEGEGRLCCDLGKPAPGPLSASPRGQAHGTVSQRGSPAWRGGPLPAPCARGSEA